jgi:multidrug resistance efflux pump
MDARCYGVLVVTTAPEAAGRIVELPVVDNKYVHKGDLLMVIDPTNYTIAVSQATAARAYGRLRCDRSRSLGPSGSAATGGCRARVKRTRANTAQWRWTTKPLKPRA